MPRPIFYEYWRSSAAYRVRIALKLKGIDYESRPIDLREGAQNSADYRAVNPYGFVPMLEIDGHRLTQSLAIINYLDLRYPNRPLIPAVAAERAHVVSLSLAIACDIHPLNNLRVLKYLKNHLDRSQAEIDEWVRHWIIEGFTALERLARASGGPYLCGAAVTIADICLVPQMYNARRVATDLSAFTTLLAVDERLQALPAFEAARPENQPDAVL